MRSIAPPKADSAPQAALPDAGQHRDAAAHLPLARRGPEGPGRVHAARSPGRTSRCTRQGGRRHLPRAREASSPRPNTRGRSTAAGNEIGTGKFRTLSADALAQIEKRKPADKAEFSDRLLFTLMLQEMGAAQEARESWARLAAGALATFPSSPRSQVDARRARRPAARVVRSPARAQPRRSRSSPTSSGNATIEGDGKLTFLAELPTGTRAAARHRRARHRSPTPSSGAEFTIAGPGRIRIGIADARSRPRRARAAQAPHRGRARATSGVVAAACHAAPRAEPAHAQRHARRSGRRARSNYPCRHARRRRCSPRCAGVARPATDAYVVRDCSGQAGVEADRGAARIAQQRASGVKLAPGNALCLERLRRTRNAGERRVRDPSGAMRIRARREVARGGARRSPTACVRALLLQDAGRARRRRARPGRSSPASAPTCRSSPPSHARRPRRAPFER